MKLFFAISLITIINLAITSSNPIKVNGIDGSIKSLHFDSTFSNSYVLSVLSNYKTSERFYKLDSKKNILLTKDFYKVSTVLLNRDNDVYVFELDENESDIEIWILHANTNIFRKISMFPIPRSNNIDVFMDTDSNIFFNTLNGVAMIKPRQNILLGINNLPDGNNYFDHVVNKFDVYLAFKVVKEPYLLFHEKYVINSTAKSQYVPNAEKIPKPEEAAPTSRSNPVQQHYLSAKEMYVGKFGTYITGKNGMNSVFFKRVDEPNGKMLLLEYDTTYKILCETDNRIFLISEKEKFFNIYLIGKDNEVLALKEIFPSSLVNSTQCATNSVPLNAYISVEKSVILVKSKEREGVKIDIPGDQDIISILVDKYDDLWVFTNDLYIVKNNSQKPTKLYSLADIDSISATKENRLTNEVYIASKNGLFVCKK